MLEIVDDDGDDLGLLEKESLKQAEQGIITLVLDLEENLDDPPKPAPKSDEPPVTPVSPRSCFANPGDVADKIRQVKPLACVIAKSLCFLWTVFLCFSFMN